MFERFLDLLARVYGRFMISPGVSVCGVLIQNNKLLLIKNYKGYSLPGGCVKNGEKIVDGLVREFKEETGFNISGNDFICFIDNPKRDTRLHTVLFAYKCKIVSGQLKGSFEGEPIWCDLNKLPKLIFGHEEIIKKILI